MIIYSIYIIIILIIIFVIFLAIKAIGMGIKAKNENKKKYNDLKDKKKY